MLHANPLFAFRCRKSLVDAPCLDGGVLIRNNSFSVKTLDTGLKGNINGFLMLSTVNKPYLMQNNKCKICYEILSIRYYGKKFLPLQPKMVVWLRLCINTLDNNKI